MVFSVICGEFVRLFRCLNIHSKKTQSCIAKKWLIKNNDLIIKYIQCENIEHIFEKVSFL